MRRILYWPRITSPSLPCQTSRPSLSPAIFFPEFSTAITPMYLSVIGGTDAVGGGPAVAVGGAADRGSTAGAGGGAFGRNRKRLRSAAPGRGRSASSAFRCTSGALAAACPVDPPRPAALVLDGAG